MTKKRIAIIIAIIVIPIIAYSYFSSSGDEDVSLTTKVVKGTFLNEVFISGEAQSTSSKKINGPSNARRFGLFNIKIEDLVPEGTVVKKGDYIGKLDVTELNGRIQDAQLNLEQGESRYIQQQLDTTLTLKQERNAIKDLLFKIEEDKLELTRSQYEPPATIRSLEINIEKTERDLKEKRADYSIKKKQANAKMIEVGTEVSKYKKRINDLLELEKEFTIYSDDDGMVTYIRERGGNKRKVGATISPWDPAVASLPDLSKMESHTFCNEVDIRKLKKGLTAKVGFDAFPDIELDGIVTDVANVGETKVGSDIKLFQVLIKIIGTDENIRPGMTTSNKILTKQEDNVLMIPLEAVFSKDSISFAYVKSGLSIEKKQVELGDANNEVIVVSKGLEEDDIVYLNKPQNLEEKSIKLLK